MPKQLTQERVHDCVVKLAESGWLRSTLRLALDGKRIVIDAELKGTSCKSVFESVARFDIASGKLEVDLPKLKGQERATEMDLKLGKAVVKALAAANWREKTFILAPLVRTGDQTLSLADWLSISSPKPICGYSILFFVEKSNHSKLVLLDANLGVTSVLSGY
jgi:hypothetical protein